MVFQKIVWLTVAGGIGTLARYGLAGLVHKIGSESFPLGTMVVNIVGCFAAGLLWTLFEYRWTVTSETRTIVLVGFMGAFTTFSTFMLENSELLRSAEWFYAITNMTLQNAVGLAAVFVGIALGRLVY